MAERIVVNTGPLITLARIDCLDVVGQLPFEFLCPEQVRKELDEGEESGHPRVTPEWLTALPLSGPLPALSVAAPLIENAVEQGARYHPEIVRAVLEAVGE